jgi:hypothetical protein
MGRSDNEVPGDARSIGELLAGLAQCIEELRGSLAHESQSPFLACVPARLIAEFQDL